MALEHGNTKSATSWLTFALTENPESVETRLFLAESLFQQNRLEESTNYLTPILRENNANPIIVSPYNKAAANNLMSRIHQKDGKLLDALDYAQQSNLGQASAHCTEGVINQRVELLANILGVNQAPEATAISTTLNTKNLNHDERYAEQCSQLKTLHREPSACHYAKPVEIYALNTPITQRRRMS